MSNSLPTDIIEHEIFSKLPVKSLIRFKCVSKSFNALISSPEFVKLHFRESRSSDANRLLILAGEDNRNLYSIDVDTSDYSVTTIPLPHTLDGSRPCNVSIVGSIDGVICVGLGVGRESSSQIKHVLINPSTRVFREIPTTTLVGNTPSSFGFGFDDLNSDFKLVRVTEIKYKDVKHRVVIIYSLNQNSWKLVEIVRDPIDSLTETQNGVLTKNHLLHWVFWRSHYNRIGCFDTRSDKWVRDVPLPPVALFAHDDKFCVRNLGVISGCLCLFITFTDFVSEIQHVVYMMKEYQGKESWVKLFHINQFLWSRFFQFTQPFFCFRRESKYEVLVANLNRKGLFWYDIGPKKYGRTIEKVKGIPAFVEGCFFPESLVQIPGGRHISQDKLNSLFSI